MAAAAPHATNNPAGSMSIMYETRLQHGEHAGCLRIHVVTQDVDVNKVPTNRASP